jgi:hypothetical protein
MNSAASLLIVLLGTPFFAAYSWAQELVLQKQGTKEYHRPGCDVVRDGKDVLAMSRAQAEGRGLKAHAGCDPARMPRSPGGAGSESTRPDAPVFVFVDAAAKPSRGEHHLYHRESCPALAKERRKLPVDDAGKQFWPCPKCKPPIRKRR